MINIALTQDTHGITPSTIYNVEVVRHGTVYGTSEKTTTQISSGSTLIHVEAPVVTASTNTLGLTKKQVLTVGAYSVTDGTNDYSAQFPHVSTDWQVYEVVDDAETLVEESLADTTNLLSYTMTNSLEESKSYRFKVKFHAAQIESSESVVDGTTPEKFATVSTPTITINYWKSELPILTGSVYRVMEGDSNVTASYPHTYTNWRCYKVVNGEDTLIWSSLNDTTNLTRIQLNTALEASTNYRFECEYGNTSCISVAGSLTGTTDDTFYTADEITVNDMINGYIGINSVEDLPAYTTGTAKLTEHGRIIYRHSNNKGSVIVFDMYGLKTAMFVPDAEYRTDGMGFGLSGVENTGLECFTATNSSDGWYVRGIDPDDYHSPLTYTYTDAQLQAMWPQFSSDKTAKQNCDSWLSLATTSDGNIDTDIPSLRHCRSLSFDGISNNCDIGNFYELEVLYLEADNVDSLDATAETYGYNLLGYRNTAKNSSDTFYGRFCVGENPANGYMGLLSSTQYSGSQVKGIGSTGLADYWSKGQTIYNVVPISELGFFANGTFHSDYDEAKAAARIDSMKANASQGLTKYGISSASDLPGYSNDGSLMYTEHERLMYRHSNGKGSVVVFDWYGTTTAMFVADAEYRGAKQFSSGSFDSSLTNFSSNNGTDWSIRNQGYEDSLKKTALGYTFTDSQLQSTWSNLSSDLTARQNCDVWMTYSQITSNSDYAVPYCRSLTSFTGIDKCDLGNLYECMILYLESDNLDSLDPTGSSNTGKLLGYNNSSSDGYGRMSIENAVAIWSSTEHSNDCTRRVVCDGGCGSNGKNNNTFGVVPIRELGYYLQGTWYSTKEEWDAAKEQAYQNTYPLDIAVLRNSNFSSDFAKVTDLPGYPEVDGSLTQSEHGRLLYRHSNGKGSVVVFDMFGTTMKLFVADAAYRTSKEWGTNGKDSSLTNYTTHVYIYNSTSYDKTTAINFAQTDSELQTVLTAYSSDKTARYNCDVWIGYQGTTDSWSISGVPAVEYARSLTSFTGISSGCDIGNQYENAVIWAESDNLDSLDPTGSSNTGKLLGYTNSGGGRFSGDLTTYIWSSTEISNAYVCGVSDIGYGYGFDESYPGGVVPVREL